jgi:hypothetical protein
MPVYRFDYAGFRDEKAPLIPIDVWGKGRWHNLWVYVDSGARFTVLHTHEARRLGVNLRRCKKYYIVAAGGQRIPVFLTTLRLRVGRTTLKAEVGFCSVLGGAFNLLGRQGVFDTFRVCFDDREQVVTFQKSAKRVGG